MLTSFLLSLAVAQADVDAAHTRVAALRAELEGMAVAGKVKHASWNQGLAPDVQAVLQADYVAGRLVRLAVARPGRTDEVWLDAAGQVALGVEGYPVAPGADMQVSYYAAERGVIRESYGRDPAEPEARLDVAWGKPDELAPFKALAAIAARHANQ